MVTLSSLSCWWLMCMAWQYAETWGFQGRHITPIHLPFQDQRGCNRLHDGIQGPPQLEQFGRNSRADLLRSRSVKRTYAAPPCMGKDSFSGDAGGEEENSSGEELETPVFRVRGLGDLTSRESALTEGRESSENQTPTDKSVPLKSTDQGSTWEAVTSALGIGPWTYVLLGSSIFIILLNTILGPGWFARVIQSDGGSDARESSSSRNGVYQIMPLDDPSNLLDYR